MKQQKFHSMQPNYIESNMSTKLKPLGNVIIFQFIDEIMGKKRAFNDVTPSGIVIVGAASHQKNPRWGKVVASGPDSGVKIDEYVLIEALKWTVSFNIDDNKHWKTESDFVLAVCDNIEDCARQ